MPNPQNLTPWKPGDSPYSDYIKGLKAKDDGSYEQHLEKRAAKRTMKAAWKEVIEHNQTKWITDMNNALAKSMQKALDNGDVEQIKKISELLNITIKDQNIEVDVNSTEVVNAIKDLAGKLPD